MSVPFAKYLIDGQSDAFADLVLTIKRNKSIAFIGSGISIDARYPDWNTLVKILCEEAEIEFDIANHEISGETLIETVEKCKVSLTEPEYHKLLKDIFDSTHKSFSKWHSQILAMPFISFPTTNIDDCHEKVLKFSSTLNIDPQIDKYPELDSKCIENRRIYYLHGKIESTQEYQNIVLAKSEYNEAYQPDYGAQKYLMEALTNYDCVFFGYSMNDPFLLKVREHSLNVNKLREDRLKKTGRQLPYHPKHFAILPDYKNSSDKQLFDEYTNHDSSQMIDYKKQQHITRDIKLRELKIQPIYYRLISDSHDALNTFIEALFDSIRLGESKDVPESGGIL